KDCWCATTFPAMEGAHTIVPRLTGAFVKLSVTLNETVNRFPGIGLADPVSGFPITGLPVVVPAAPWAAAPTTHARTTSPPARCHGRLAIIALPFLEVQDRAKTAPIDPILRQSSRSASGIARIDGFLRRRQHQPVAHAP